MESCEGSWVNIRTGLKANDSSDRHDIKDKNAKLSTALMPFNNDITARCSCISVTDNGLLLSYLSLLLIFVFIFVFLFLFSIGLGQDNTTTISNNI